MDVSACAKCGAPLEAGQAFCKSCGAACSGRSAGEQAVEFRKGCGSGSEEPGPREDGPGKLPKVGLLKRLLGSKGKARKVSRNEKACDVPANVATETACPQCGRPVREWHRCCLGCGCNLESLHRRNASRKSAPSFQESRCDLEDRTISLELEGSGYDDETTVLDETPVLYLTRLATSERMELFVPAVIGKGTEATCRVGGNAAISRRHARVDCLGEEVYVEDLGSKNKTKVNGVVVEAGARVQVKNADILSLANEEFTLTVERRA